MTRIVDMGQPEAHFDFLGYQFWRGKTSERIRRFVRPKSGKKFKADIKPLTRRTSGQSLTVIVQRLRAKLQGFFGYFKYAVVASPREMDERICGRLRGILLKKGGLRSRGRDRDHQRWKDR